MRHFTKPSWLFATSALSALGVLALLTTAAESPDPTKPREATVAGLCPLVFGSSIPLAVQSAGIEWRGNTYHLVTFSSIQFDLDKTNHLKAEIQAGVTTFDDVDYDISGAVFDAAGQMLRTARVPGKVERMWLGHVLQVARTLTLDFGVSLDYPRATAFIVSISKRHVLTPDAWQK